MQHLHAVKELWIQFEASKLGKALRAARALAVCSFAGLLLAGCPLTQPIEDCSVGCDGPRDAASAVLEATVADASADARAAASVATGAQPGDAHAAPSDAAREDAGADTGLDASLVDTAFDAALDAAFDAGDAAPPPVCSGACTAELCDPESDTCWECTQDAHCNDGVCDLEQHTCVACRRETTTTGLDVGCSLHTPYCWLADSAPSDAGSDTGLDTRPAPHTDSAQCVECLENADCTGGNPWCHPETYQCVECSTNDDCTDPAAARCDVATGACGGCDETVPAADEGNGPHPDCERFADQSACHAGACVECFGEQRAACGNFLCRDLLESGETSESELYTCSADVLPESALWCASCISDAQCHAGEACFLSLGGHGSCLELKAMPVADSTRIRSPVVERAISASGLGSEGTGVEYLALRPTVTCALVRQLWDEGPSAGCLSDTDCGEPDVDDALCDDGRCTVTCDSDSDCGDYFYFASYGWYVRGACVDSLCEWEQSPEE